MNRRMRDVGSTQRKEGMQSTIGMTKRPGRGTPRYDCHCPYPRLLVTLAEQRQSMSWAQRLCAAQGGANAASTGCAGAVKRVFQIDINQRPCGGKLNLIASIEDPATIHRILERFARQARGPSAAQQP